MGNDKNYGELYRDFYKDLYNNIIPNYANQELKYYINCRKKRLERLNLKEEYDIDSDNNGIHSSNHIFSEIAGTSKYNTKNYYSCFNRTKKYINDGNVIYKKKERIYFFETIYDILDTPNKSNFFYNCPNCGAPSKLEELEVDGCKYCHTKFIMDDLFPRVSNYYTMLDMNVSTEDRKKFMHKCGFLSGIVLTTWFYFSNNENLENIVVKILSIIFIFALTYFVGIFIGTMLSFNNMLLKTIKSFFSNSDIIPINKSSKDEISKTLKQYNLNFEYEYFESKVLSLIRNILLNDDRHSLPQNNIENLDKRFDNLVDIVYRQVMKLKDIRVVDNKIVIDLYVYLNNDYFIEGKIVNKNECLLVTMKHDNNYKIDTEFLLSAVNCKSCGGSFDATHQKECPYCSTQYDLEKDDWVVDNIQC